MGLQEGEGEGGVTGEGPTERRAEREAGLRHEADAHGVPVYTCLPSLWGSLGLLLLFPGGPLKTPCLWPSLFSFWLSVVNVGHACVC